jgi:esterase
MSLNFLSWGDGPPLVILHGLFGSARNWTSIGKALADDYRVIAVDMPNHGSSPWQDDVSYTAMAQTVGSFLQGEGLGSAPVLGHSMGGKTAMALALMQPELIGRLFVLDIAPVTYDHDNNLYIKAMEAVDLDNLTGRGDADDTLAEWVDDPNLRGFFLLNLVRDGDGYAWQINLPALKAGLSDLHSFPDFTGQSYGGPALFVGGEKSDYILAAHHGLIGQLFPASHIQSIPGAGHWVHAEKPVDVTAAIRTFLEA